MVKTLEKAEFRAIGTRDFNTNDNTLNVSGYVNQTGTKSELLYDWFEDTEFYEVIQPGVFQNAIDDSDFVDFYYEHDPDKYLASTKDGSLALEEDDVGLKMNANIVDTSWGQDAYEMIKGGRIAGMSFGFIVTGEEWDTSGDTPIRTITGIQLFEVSAVRFPAYPASDIQARNKQRKELNTKLEARGMELRHVKVPNKKEVRDDMADNPVTSTDINNLINAINNQTDCINDGINSLLDSASDENRSKRSKESRSETEGENSSSEAGSENESNSGEENHESSDDNSDDDSDKEPSEDSDNEKSDEAKKAEEQEAKELDEKRSKAIEQLRALEKMK